MTIARSDIRRLWLGHYIQPPGRRHGGKAIPVTGFAIRHPDGLVLFDTGFGPIPDDFALEAPVYSNALADQLQRLGYTVDDVRLIVNCHLHIDHAGGNRLFSDRRILAQRREYDDVCEPDYYLPVIDFPGARYELVDGAVTAVPGIDLIPTPGHTPGHQSAVVHCTDGTVVLVGQAFGQASDLAVAAFNHNPDDPLDDEPGWLVQLLDHDPVQILLAHDTASWHSTPGWQR